MKNITLSTFAVTKNDTQLIPLYSNNFIDVTINECVKITALIDTGAGVSVINAKTLEKLRARGQRCDEYECKNIKLNAISGTELNVIGRVYLRVHMNNCLLRIPAYVVSNMVNSFVIGNDTLRKHRMIIDFNSNNLLIKSENVHALDYVVIPPRKQVKVRMAPKTRAIIPGAIGQVCLHDKLGHMGLTSDMAPVTMPIDSTLSCMIYNKSRRPIYIRRNKCMGTFRVYAKEHDVTSINRTQTKNSTRKPSDNRMQNNEQSNVTTNKQTAQTSSKHDKYISNINANEDTSNKPLEFDINSNLTHEQKIKLNNLLNKYRDVFSKHSHDLGEFTGGEFKIELKPDAKPVKNLPHRASPRQRQMIDEEVDKLLKAGIIEPCLADYSSPVLLVPKGIDERGRPKEHRLVIDYRQVNNQIKAAHLGPPQLHDFLDTLGGTQGRHIKYFTTLDCVQGYLQIRMHEGSRDYTSFVTHSGQYRYLRAPFGLKTSGSQFIALVNDLFREKLYKDVLVYLDDIVCFSEEFEDHLKTLEWVLNKLLKSKLKLKAPKCKFAYNKVKYLGHIVSEAGVSPDPNKLHAILDYAPPKNAKQVKQILGSFNFYRKFIPNFSKYSKCLTDLTRKNVPFIWTDECQRNFQILKEKLMTAPVTAFPRFTTENGELPKFNVYTDASKEALAAILTQVQDNNERLISCIGRNMLPAEMRYSTHEKEALAIFYAFKKFDSYLRYAHTTVYTDCSSLSSILKRPGNAVSPRIARYVYALTAYEYDIVYRKGAINHCDSFSRNKYSQELTQEDVEPNTYPFMNAVHSQASTHLDTNSLHIAAGSRYGLHVARMECLR